MNTISIFLLSFDRPPQSVSMSRFGAVESQVKSSQYSSMDVKLPGRLPSKPEDREENLSCDGKMEHTENRSLLLFFPAPMLHWLQSGSMCVSNGLVLPYGVLSPSHLSV